MSNSRYETQELDISNSNVTALKSVYKIKHILYLAGIAVCGLLLKASIPAPLAFIATGPLTAAWLYYGAKWATTTDAEDKLIDEYEAGSQSEYGSTRLYLYKKINNNTIEKVKIMTRGELDDYTSKKQEKMDANTSTNQTTLANKLAALNRPKQSNSYSYITFKNASSELEQIQSKSPSLLGIMASAIYSFFSSPTEDKKVHINTPPTKFTML